MSSPIARVLAAVALAAFFVSLGVAVMLGLGDDESAAVRPPVPTTGTTTRTLRGAMEETYAQLARHGTQEGLLDRMQSRRELYDVIRYGDYEALDGSIARSVVPDVANPGASGR